jgi:hypothetical protein
MGNLVTYLSPLRKWLRAERQTAVLEVAVPQDPDSAKFGADKAAIKLFFHASLRSSVASLPA